MNEKLSKYIKSKGLILPDRIHVYKSGGTSDHLCPFCEQHHSGFPILMFPVQGTTEGYTYTTCNACWECAREIQALEAHLQGPPPRGTLFDHIDNTAVARIELYVKFGKFQSNVDLHYQYLPIPEFPNREHCYFCKSFCADFSLISVPVRGDASKITGGLVRICVTCRNYAEKTYELEVPINHSAVHIYPSRGQRCSNCDHLYLIDADEHQYRNFPLVNEDADAYLCPECAVAELEGDVMWESGGTMSHLMPPDRDPVLYNSYTYLQRFYKHTCTYCDEGFLIDAMLPNRALRAWHMVQGKMICKDCIIHKSGRAPIIVLKCARYYIGVYSTGRDDFFKIRIRDKNSDTVIIFDKSGWLPDLIVTLREEYLEKQKRELLL